MLQPRADTQFKAGDLPSATTVFFPPVVYRTAVYSYDTVYPRLLTSQVPTLTHRSLCDRKMQHGANMDQQSSALSHYPVPASVAREGTLWMRHTHRLTNRPLRPGRPGVRPEPHAALNLSPLTRQPPLFQQGAGRHPRWRATPRATVPQSCRVSFQRGADHHSWPPVQRPRGWRAAQMTDD